MSLPALLPLASASRRGAARVVQNIAPLAPDQDFEGGALSLTAAARLAFRARYLRERAEALRRVAVDDKIVYRGTVGPRERSADPLEIAFAAGETRTVSPNDLFELGDGAPLTYTVTDLTRSGTVNATVADDGTLLLAAEGNAAGSELLGVVVSSPAGAAVATVLARVE